MSSSTKPTNEKVVVNPADDDDLDELDDVLDQFDSSNSPPPAATTFGNRPRTNTRVDAAPPSIPGKGPALGATAESEEVDEDLLSSEFAKELAKGMENLMRELGAEAAGASTGEEGEELSEEQQKAFKAAWEAMLVDGMNGKDDGTDGEDPLLSLGEILKGAGQPAASTSKGDGTKKLDETLNFQDKIKQAMNKLKEVEEKSKAGGTAPGSESIEELLKSLGDLGLGDLGLGGEGGGDSEAELAGFLETMMGQLMSKEILYDPLKELAQGFPGYLANPPKPLSAEDRTRYEKQMDCVTRIVAVFERPDYSDSNAESNKLVVDLMSEMQSYGSPPAEIMGELPPGFTGDGPMDENCTIA